MLNINITPYLDKTNKLNLPLPGYVIHRINPFVREHTIKSRSSLLTDATLQKLRR